MAFQTSLATTTAIAASALPAVFALSSSSHSFRFPKPQNLSFLSSPNPKPLFLTTNFTNSPSALHMESPTSERKPSFQSDAVLPELMTEYMVDMKCEGCVNAVKNKLQIVDGETFELLDWTKIYALLPLICGNYLMLDWFPLRVKSVEADLDSQVVRILGSTPLKTMTEALEQTGRKARLIGQGIPEDFLVSAAVAEFKGPDVFGVVRFAQVNMELSRIEANFSGLSPWKHGWSINEFGDLTKGAASTGKVFNPSTEGVNKPLGDLGTLDTDENGNAFSGVKAKMRVSDLIGRSIAVYGTADKSDSGVAAAVIARSAGVGENYKKLCTCDGTTIWESSERPSPARSNISSKPLLDCWSHIA